MKAITTPISLAAIALLTACASQPPTATSSTTASTTTAASTPVQAVTSRGNAEPGQITGTPLQGGKFSKLKIGIHMNEVQDLMGRAPDRFHTYESGKRWIPFYFGSDARRMQVLYKEEGCLTFTGGNVWGGSGGELIQIENDTSGACYQP